MLASLPLDERSTRYVTVGYATVEAGETMTATFGGVGRPVTGRLTLPPGTPADADAFIWCQPTGPVAAGRPMSGGTLAVTPEFVCFPNGTFRADDVSPGTYRLTISVRSHFSPQHQAVQDLASGVARLTVPTSPRCPTDVPIDLGRIETFLVKKP